MDNASLTGASEPQGRKNRATDPSCFTCETNRVLLRRPPSGNLAVGARANDDFADRRREKEGSNMLTPPPPESELVKFLRELFSLFSCCSSAACSSSSAARAGQPLPRLRADLRRRRDRRLRLLPEIQGLQAHGLLHRHDAQVRELVAQRAAHQQARRARRSSWASCLPSASSSPTCPRACS